MVWYSHLIQNFPQFIVIHTVKGFGIVNKAEIYVFCFLFFFFSGTLAFLMIQQMLAIGSLVPLPFKIQLEHREVLGSHTAEAWLGEF